ncbi:MAG TPA: YihY/virulence factor BrkB family protein [bacterium]|nr:YihY/virulence factor BrkB family protein [bacterium]
MTRGAARELAVELWRRMGRHDVYVLASATAYAAVLSVFPLLVAVIALLSLVIQQPAAQETVVRAMRPYLPDQALVLVTETLDRVVQTQEAAGLIGAFGLFWGATAVTGALRRGLNRVLGGVPRPFWHQKLMDLVMVLLAGLFLSLSVVGSAALAALTIPPLAQAVDRAVGTAGQVAAILGPVVLSAAAFFIAYRFLPNVRLRRRSLLWGMLTGMVLFELLKGTFFWYLRTLARYPVVYGPLAGLIVFMVWVYLVSVVVLLGAEIMGVMEAHG